jgi:hypothetical protein
MLWSIFHPRESKGHYQQREKKNYGGWTWRGCFAVWCFESARAITAHGLGRCSNHAVYSSLLAPAVITEQSHTTTNMLFNSIFSSNLFNLLVCTRATMLPWGVNACDRHCRSDRILAWNQHLKYSWVETPKHVTSHSEKATTSYVINTKLNICRLISSLYCPKYLHCR